MDTYLLEIGVAWCACDIRVNDVPIFEDPGDDGRVDLERVVSHFVWTGSNALSFELLPLPSNEERAAVPLHDPRVACEVRLRRRGASGGVETVAALAFSGARLRGAVDLGVTADGAREGARVIQADATRVAAWCEASVSEDIPRWSWTTGSALDASPALRAELVARYAAIAQAAARRDSTFIRDALGENQREVQLAMDCDAPSAREILGVERLIADPSVEAIPVSEDVRVEVFGYGRLARLVDRRGDSALQFREPARGLRTYVDLFLADLPGRGLTAVR